MASPWIRTELTDHLMERTKDLAALGFTIYREENQGNVRIRITKPLKSKRLKQVQTQPYNFQEREGE